LDFRHRVRALRKRTRGQHCCGPRNLFDRHDFSWFRPGGLPRSAHGAPTVYARSVIFMTAGCYLAFCHKEIGKSLQGLACNGR
jgi:hypothetical protein